MDGGNPEIILQAYPFVAGLQAQSSPLPQTHYPPLLNGVDDICLSEPLWAFTETERGALLVSSLVPGIKAVLERRISTNHFSFIFLIFIDLSVPDYLVAGCRILVATYGIFQLWHARSNSLTRDQTQAPCIGSRKPYLLDPQGSANFWWQVHHHHKGMWKDYVL